MGGAQVYWQIKILKDLLSVESLQVCDSVVLILVPLFFIIFLDHPSTFLSPLLSCHVHNIPIFILFFPLCSLLLILVL